MENDDNMNDQEKKKGHTFWRALLHQKCPRCREGDMFIDKNPYHLNALFKMNDQCSVCGQRMEIEPGFYFGTAYVSYSLTVAFSVSTFVAWWVLIGLSTRDNRIFWWVGINGVFMIVLQPFFMRLSRVIWLSFFVKYNENWQMESDPERNDTH